MDENKHLANAIEDMRHLVCGSCREYKGMAECSNEECGQTWCIFCEDATCPDCGSVVGF